jgi:integrase
MSYGEGSIFKHRDAKGRTFWKVEVVIGHKPDGTRRRTRRTAKTYAEAIQMRRQLVTDRDEYDLSFDNPTLDTFALWWIREVRALKIKQSTAADYEYRYRKMISPTFGFLNVDKIDTRSVATWTNILLKSYSSASVNGALRVLKMVLGAAVEHGHLRMNVASPVPRVSTRGTRSEDNPPWDLHASQQAIATAQDHWFGVPVLLALVLGLRRGEILGLKWGDFDFDTRTVHIRRSRREFLAYDSAGKSHLETNETDPKTRSAVRSLQISDSMRDLLWSAMCKPLGGPFGTDDLYVVGGNGGAEPMSPTVFRRGFDSFLKDSRLRRVRFHDLRHSCAQHALAGGARIESVSQALGHSRIDITKAIYAPSVQALSNEFSAANERQFFG